MAIKNLDSFIYFICIWHSLRSWLHFSLKKTFFLLSPIFFSLFFSSLNICMPFGVMNMLVILQMLHSYFFAFLVILFCPLRTIFIRFRYDTCIFVKKKNRPQKRPFPPKRKKKLFFFNWGQPNSNLVFIFILGRSSLIWS